MSEAEVVANRILKVLQGKKQKSVWIRYTQKIGEVVLDFSNDISSIAVNFIDTDNRYRNETNTHRLIFRLKKGLREQDLSEIINITLKIFTSEIKKNKKTHIEEGLARATGKAFLNAALINDLASIFSEKFIGKMTAGLIVSTIYSIGGAASRAVYTSERLKVVNNTVYNELRMAGDLDLFYFLVENYTGPFLDAMTLKERNPSAWNEMLSILSKNLNCR
ncbi:hypothetical protein AAFN90_03120 [Erwiniaceae bacterium CAU 1747]